MQTSSPSRVILITGGAGGIGAAIAQALLEDGHRIAAVDRDAAALDRLSAAHAGADTPILPKRRLAAAPSSKPAHISDGWTP
jgi:NAD(P)-dependent dehydrogenase (short-subunit alcohol dehydrogenase family)